MAMRMNDEAESRPDPKQAPRRKSVVPKILLFLGILIFLLAAAVAGFYFFGDEVPLLGWSRTGGVADDGPREYIYTMQAFEQGLAEPDDTPSYSYSMQEFQVNLADQDTRRFLRTTMDLAFNDRGLDKEINNRESELRSHIISILRSKSINDLNEPGGMSSLEMELILRLNSLLESGRLEAIYFREFIYQ